MTTAYLTHQDYVLHTLEGHPEHAGRLKRLWQVFEQEGVLPDLDIVPVEPATLAHLTLVHAPSYVKRVGEAAEQGGGLLDSDTYLLEISYDIALKSAGAAVGAVDAILRDGATNAIAAVRPPGHHATPSHAMGFCIFSNVAVAATHAKRAYPEIERVMVVDFDVHHGNGTQDCLIDDPDILFVSSHQYPYYPGTGAVTDIGYGEAKGATLNMPLQAGVGNDGFRLLYERVLWKAARRFKPDMILVSAGFDAHWADPLAMLQLDLHGYAYLSRELIRMADDLCRGRIAFVMEGGYDLDVLSYGMLNTVYALLGQDEIKDPHGKLKMPQQPVDKLLEDLLRIHQLD